MRAWKNAPVFQLLVKTEVPVITPSGHYVKHQSLVLSDPPECVWINCSFFSNITDVWFDDEDHHLTSRFALSYPVFHDVDGWTCLCFVSILFFVAVISFTIPVCYLWWWSSVTLVDVKVQTASCCLQAPLSAGCRIFSPVCPSSETLGCATELETSQHLSHFYNIDEISWSVISPRISQHSQWWNIQVLSVSVSGEDRVCLIRSLRQLRLKTVRTSAWTSCLLLQVNDSFWLLEDLNSQKPNALWRSKHSKMGIFLQSHMLSEDCCWTELSDEKVVRSCWILILIPSVWFSCQTDLSVRCIFNQSKCFVVALSEMLMQETFILSLKQSHIRDTSRRRGNRHQSHSGEKEKFCF